MEIYYIIHLEFSSKHLIHFNLHIPSAISG